MSTRTTLPLQPGEALEVPDSDEQQRMAGIGLRLAGVFHDFRSLINVISNYSEMMADCDDREERMKYSELLQRQFEMVTSLTTDVMSFVRGETTILVRRVFVNLFLDSVVTQLRKEFVGTELLIEVDAQYLGIAYFDEQKLLRAACILGRNAREAMKDIGVFRIGTRVDEKYLYLEFADTGPGIPAALAGRLFQSFASVDKEGGTGIGLATVKRIVTEHSGTVDCESVPGQGATFIIALPRDKISLASGTGQTDKVEG